MKEKILAEWNRKYERIQWELKDTEKKLENVKKRQKDLLVDIFVSILFALVSLGIVFFCWHFRETVSYIFYGAFYPIYLIVLYGLGIAAIIYYGYQFCQRVRRYIRQMRKIGSLEYPKPEIVRSNDARCIPVNYYAERKCVEWLRHQYTDEIMQLIALKREIDRVPEQNLPLLQEKLDSILFYERVKRAK